MPDSPMTIRAGLAGIPGAGRRSLITALIGETDASRGVRAWDGVDIQIRPITAEATSLADIDLLVIVVSAKQGVPADLNEIWTWTTECGVPAIIVVTHLDDSLADLEEIAAMCSRTFTDAGEIFLPRLPILDDEERVCGFIDLLSEEIVEWSEGGPVVHASEPRHQELIEDARAELCESVMLAVDDDDLFDRYLSGEPIAGEVIEEHMIEQVSRGMRHPVLGTALIPRHLGIGLVLDTIAALATSRTH